MIRATKKPKYNRVMRKDRKMQFYGCIGETIVYKGASYSEIILEKEGKRETIDLGDGF